MKKTTRVALGGMVSAVAILLMLMTGLMPFATYALPAIAGALLIVISVEISQKWAYLVYIAISLLSIFITPDREAAMLFIVFFGHYPITKAVIERLRKKALEYLLKYLLFNVCMIGGFLFMLYVVGSPEMLQGLNDFGKYTALIMLAGGNVIFLIYDIALTRVISAYIHWFRPNFLKKL